MESPIAEQEICVKCGLCCDGTIFSGVALEKSEKDNLPPEFAKAYDHNSEKERFLQPCPAFDQKCTIYHKKRAKVCGSFRCQLLIDFSKNKLTRQEADEIVKNAIIFKTRILDLNNEIAEKTEDLPFWKLSEEIKKKLKQIVNDKPLRDKYESILANLTIFNALLIKHFKSSRKFQDLMR